MSARFEELLNKIKEKEKRANIEFSNAKKKALKQIPPSIPVKPVAAEVSAQKKQQWINQRPFLMKAADVLLPGAQYRQPVTPSQKPAQAAKPMSLKEALDISLKRPKTTPLPPGAFGRGTLSMQGREHPTFEKALRKATEIVSPVMQGAGKGMLADIAFEKAGLKPTKQVEEAESVLAAKHPWLRTGGELAGMTLPVGGLYGSGTKLAAKLIPEVAPGLVAKLGRTVIPGAFSGAVYEGGKAALEGEPAGDIAKQAAIGAALFSGGDIAARGLVKTAIGAWKRLKNAPKPEIPAVPKRPPLAPPAAPGEGHVYRPVSWRPGPTAKPVPKETGGVPASAKAMAGSKLVKAPKIVKKQGKIKKEPVKELPSPELTKEKIPVNRLSANTADLAADYKAQGMDKFRAWSQFIIDRSLKPEMDAKDFYKIYELVPPKLLEVKKAIPKAEMPKTTTAVINPEYARRGEPVEVKTIIGRGKYEYKPAVIERVLKNQNGEDVFEVIPEGLSSSVRVKAQNIKFLPRTGGVETMAAKPAAGEIAAIPVGKETVGPTARNVIIKRLQKALDIPIRVGRFREKAEGIFKIKPEVVRTKLAEDMPVISHEVGHYLDKYFGIRNAVTDTATRQELISLGKEQSNKPAKQFTEGIAEYVRHYLSGKDTIKIAPKFHEWFENNVKQEPKIWDALQQFKQDYIDYATAPAAARVKAAISVGAKEKRKVTIDRIMGAAIDELRPIDTMVEKATGGKQEGLSAVNNPFVRAWLFRGWTGKAKSAIHFGVFDKQGKKVAPGFMETIQPVTKNIDDFRAYIVAKRAVELHKRNINPGIELDDAKATIAQYDSPIFREAHDKLKQFQNAILDRLVVSGILSSEQREAIRLMNLEYVPFYRVFEEEAGGIGFGKRGFGDLPQAVKRIKGSGRTIIDPLESIIKNTYYLTNLAERNNVGRSLVDFAEMYPGMGKYIEKVPPKMYPTTFSLDEITGLLDQVGVQVPDDALKKIATIFRPQMLGAPKENILTVFRNGKRELYQLDPELYRATLMLDKEAMNTLVKMLSYPTSWLRAGATLTPEFMIRNVARDAMSAWVYSKYGFVPVVDTVRGLFHVIKRDDLYKKWLSSGGASGNFVSLDRDYLQGDLRRLMTTTIWGKMKQYVTHPLEVLRALSEFSEEATRLGEFGKGLRAELKAGIPKGEALQRAALASRDITLDFSRMGTMGRPANQLVAFFNASVQGLDKMRRAFTKGGAKGIANNTFKASVGITLPSIALWAMNHNNPRYQELPQWRKDLFWNILTPKHVISIPKPFELGIIFGTLPERVMDWLWDNDQEAMKQFKHTLTEVTFPNWIPTALLPIIEVASNYSFFKGQPLTPMGEQYLLKQEQYGSYTTEAAKAISRLTGTGREEAALSPREIENLVRGYTGGLGGHGLAGISAVMPKESPTPKKDISEYPGIKGVLSEHYKGSASIDRFYKELEEIEKKAKTAKKYIDADKPVPEKIRYNPDKLDYMHSVQKSLTDLRKQKQLVFKNKTMTPEQKKNVLDEINMEMINRARRVTGKERIKTD